MIIQKNDHIDIIDTTPVLKNALRDPEILDAYVDTVLATILFRVGVCIDVNLGESIRFTSTFSL